MFDSAGSNGVPIGTPRGNAGEHKEGHIGAALVCYAPVGAVVLALGFNQLALLGAVGAVGLAMLPDFDRRVPFVTHRGPTHTVWFAFAVAVVLGVLGGLAGASDGVLSALGLAVFGFIVGSLTVGSHIVTDSLTPAGVRPLAPYRDDFYCYEIARASNPLANYALLGVGVLAVAVALWLGSTVAAIG